MPDGVEKPGQFAVGPVDKVYHFYHLENDDGAKDDVVEEKPLIPEDECEREHRRSQEQHADGNEDVEAADHECVYVFTCLSVYVGYVKTKRERFWSFYRRRNGAEDREELSQILHRTLSAPLRHCASAVKIRSTRFQFTLPQHKHINT